MTPTQTSSEKFDLKINGYQVSFRKSGTGFPLVLIHTWHPYAKHLLDALPESSPQIITFDTPGYYNKVSGKLLTNLDEVNRLLVAIFDRFQFQKVDLLGQCLGSVIVINFAAQHPERVRNLFCVTPPLLCYKPKVNKGLTTVFSLLERNRLAQFLTIHLVVKRNVLKKLSDIFGGYKGLTEVFAKESSLVSQTDFNPSVFFRILSDAFKLDLDKLVKKIEARTLFISGAKDPLARKQDLEKIVKPMKNASYQIVPGARHALVVKNHKKLTQALLPFLR